MTVIATYEYKDIETGQLIAKKVRKAPKSFEWHSDEKVSEKTLPLYNAHKVVNFPPEKVIVFVEGEKSADALQELGVLAVCLPGGAASKPTAEQLKVLSGRRIAIWPDKDQPGRMLMRRVYERLRPVALEIRTIYPASVPPKGDAFDWIQGGGTLNELAVELQKNPRNVLVEKQLNTVRLDEVEPAEIEWLWKNYLPLGMLTMMEGEKGQGKSWLTLNLAAAVSNGTMGTVGEGNVLMLCHEDPIEEVIVPRLKAMGAKMSNIEIIKTTIDAESGEETWFDIGEDIMALEDKLLSDDFKLLIIDPINNYINMGVDTYKDSHMRSVLSPLADMAQRTSACVIGIRHTKKDKSGGMLDWGLGSVAYGAVARTVHMIMTDPIANNEERLLVPVATNIAAKPQPIAFQIVSDGIGAKFEWRGPRDYTEDIILKEMRKAKTKDDGWHENKIDKLQKILSDGNAHSFKTVRGELGVSSITLLDYLYRNCGDSYSPESIDVNGDIPVLKWGKANKKETNGI